jgi:hypothetical protein
MGFCQKHYDEHSADERLRDDAVRLLHSSLLDDRQLVSSVLRNELSVVQKWWVLACDATNRHRTDTILKDEAPYALDWCISLAKEIIIADRNTRKGERVGNSLEYTRSWVLDRFSNLESGLMSNGIKRPEK